MNFKLSLILFASVFTFSSITFAQKQKDPIVLTVDGQEVRKSEFLRSYLKNNDNPKYDKETLDEYVELYTRFKLKVAEANALQYDTLPALMREFNGYKEQLAQPYLVDSKKADALVDEAYERLTKEVRASHILISVGKEASPADTLKAYNRALALKKRIEKGESFESVASGPGGSEDPSAKTNKGDLGYFTAFQMVYPFESAAYNTPIGEISMPVRSSYGYHIVKVTDIREARGAITSAHIMIVTQKSDSKEELEKAEKKINEIYQKLEEGEEFEKLARLYSDDRGTRERGGVLPAFGSGTNQRMVTEFEDAAFALTKDGEYSKPFKTDYGYHIVKRISHTPLGTKSELEKEIKQKINSGDRSKQSSDAFLAKLKTENKFKDKSNKRLAWFYNAIDSSIFKADWKAPELAKKHNKWVFKYNKKKFLAGDFLDYLESHRYTKPMAIQNFINQEYGRWQSGVIMNDEKNSLEEKYPEYKAIVQEYKDGILLYEIMKDKVWDKAIKDSLGLDDFYQNNIEKYQWPARLDATIYSSVDKERIMEAELLNNIDTIKMTEVLQKVNAESELNLKAENGKFIPTDHEALKNQNLKQGKNDIYKVGDKYYLVIVHEKLAAGPKKLREARGIVIQDYQNHLDKTWLEELQQKYKVVINKDILHSIGD